MPQLTILEELLRTTEDISTSKIKLYFRCMLQKYTFLYFLVFRYVPLKTGKLKRSASCRAGNSLQNLI